MPAAVVRRAVRRWQANNGLREPLVPFKGALQYTKRLYGILEGKVFRIDIRPLKPRSDFGRRPATTLNERERLDSGPWSRPQTAGIQSGARLMPIGQLAQHDRKRVVSGKSVSVRVDIGGRRYIKKKNTIPYQHTTT